MRGKAKGMVLFAIGALAVTTVAAVAMTLDVIDQTGAQVAIELPVEHVVSVYGPGTFSLYALGAADRLEMAWYVGVRGLAQASASLHRLEPSLAELLGFGDPSVEEMIAREADVIFVDGSRHGAFAQQMNGLGVPTVQFLVETPAALLESLRLLGAILGEAAAERADAFAADYERVTSILSAAQAGLAEEDRPRVLFVGTDPLTVASGDMYQHLLIEAAGGRSVTGDLVGYWNEVNLEQVLLWNPDVIIIAPYGAVQPETILDNTDWQAVAAVRAGRVHRMPRVLAPMDTPVPESLLGVIWMASVLYPDLPVLNLEAEAVAFYTEYYGYSLSPDEIAHLLGQ